MTVAEDRVIEIALDEVLGGFVVEDLTSQIIVVTERFGRGATAPRPRRHRRVRDLRPESREVDRPHESKGVPWGVVLAAASILVTLAVFLLMQDEAPTLATTDRLVVVWRGDEELLTDRLIAADCVVTRDSDLRLSFANGVAVEVRAESVLHLVGERRVELLRGGLTLASHKTPPVIATPNRVVVTPRAEASMRLDLTDWPAGPNLRETVETMIKKKTLVATTLALTVMTGNADVLTAQGGRVVNAGASANLGGEAKMIKVHATEKERDLMKRCIATLRAFKAYAKRSPDEEMMQMKNVSEASGDLTTLMRQRPELMFLCREDLAKVRIPKKPSIIHEALLNVLVLDSDPLVTKRVLGILKVLPQVVTMSQLITLAGRGKKSAIARIEQIVTKKPKDISLVPYAAILAMYKKRIGETILRTYLEKVPATRLDDRTLMASVGLHMLGDGAAWQKMVDRVKMGVDRRLAKGEIRSAAFEVLRATYYKKAISSGKPIVLGGVLDPVQDHYSANFAKLTESAAIVAALNKL